MLEFWATEKHIGKLGDETEHRRKHSENLEAQTRALYMENVNLQLSIEQEEEHFQLLLAGYNTYRNKMDAHREVIAYVEGKTATTRELLEKREIVKKLREKKEELRIDLENPEGNVVRHVQGDIYNLKLKISEVKETVNKKIACLVKEQEVHIQLKKEVEPLQRLINILKEEPSLSEGPPLHVKGSEEHEENAPSDKVINKSIPHVYIKRE
ncbi:Coiled-coil domain-containing protein 122 [Acipenser ruthenus]|uniref:Coiled-coil domain-containing protein 122 n=1 Tax=Acipenser ruthenus TaxID=7906 RepID=A0A662YPZ4_ACIRT|nr:Coiled-coil domain-containing protein 122 [Acipenser ruthenus]